MRIKLTTETMGWMSLFNKFTRVDVRDCFIDNNNVLIFVVNTGNVGKAVGKNAVNVRKLEAKLKRKIKILEYNPDVVKFVRNIVYPLKAKEIAVEDNIVMIMPLDSKTRGYLIGRAASALRNTEIIVKRYFPEIEEIKVI